MANRIEARPPAHKPHNDAGFGQLDRFEEWRRKKHAAEENQQVEHDLPMASHAETEEIHRQAAEAWARLERGQGLVDWLAVGASLEADRPEAKVTAQHLEDCYRVDLSPSSKKRRGPACSR